MRRIFNLIYKAFNTGPPLLRFPPRNSWLHLKVIWIVLDFNWLFVKSIICLHKTCKGPHYWFKVAHISLFIYLFIFK